MTHVTYEQRDQIAVIGMDDGKANALGYAMMKAVEEALDRAEREASAVVLTGRKGRFSAGFDLAEMMGGIDKVRALVTRGADFLMRLYVFPQPLVVACTGHALAGGALTVLTGDVRVAARGAFRVGLNEVQIGMPVPILAMELARDRLRPDHLTAATLFANVVDPEGALAAGWFDELADDTALLDTALGHARRLAKLPREPYGKTKTALRERTVRYVRETLAEDMRRLTPPVPAT
jgi:enoyl-CoA hydratase